MKKLFALLTALSLAAAATPALAADSGADEAMYKEAYGTYKTFYNETYKPSYYAYNDQLKEFAASVKTMKLETVEDFNKVKSFIDQLKSERKAFFGDRETPGTSRYEVPRMRDAMYAAEEAGDFSEATEQCLWLTNKIRYRMLFIEDMTDRIGNFAGTL